MVRNLPSGVWEWGYTPNTYSENVFDGDGNSTREFTREGSLINEYKYKYGVSDQRRQQIVDELLIGLNSFINTNVKRVYSVVPFDIAISVPSNRSGHASLPEALVRGICSLNNQIQYIEAPLFKTRPSRIMKEIPRDHRAKAVEGLYAVDLRRFTETPKGILVVDDVFQTGSTLNSICATLTKQFPKVPIFALAITDLGAAK